MPLLGCHNFIRVGPETRPGWTGDRRQGTGNRRTGRPVTWTNRDVKGHTGSIPAAYRHAKEIFYVAWQKAGWRLMAVLEGSSLYRVQEGGGGG